MSTRNTPLMSLAAAGPKISGWGTWIRTKIDGVRVRSSTVELSPNGRLKARFRA